MEYRNNEEKTSSLLIITWLISRNNKTCNYNKLFHS